MTAFEIKVSAESGKIRPLSRSIVWGNLPPASKIDQAVENMMKTAQDQENELSNLNF